MKYLLAQLIFFLLLFSSCRLENKKSIITDQALNLESPVIEKGKSIAKSSFGALSFELQKALLEGGVPNAIQYCNLTAISLTDSLSNANHATIKRTSLRYRNPKNKPTPEETEQLLAYQERLNNNESLQATMKSTDREDVFYSPIILQEMCLQCHGDKNKIEAYDLIESLYPEDQAIGYHVGDLRGMWSISFLKEQ